MKNKLILVIILLILVGVISSIDKRQIGRNFAEFIKDIITKVDYTKQTEDKTSTTSSKTAESLKLCAQKSGVWYQEEKLCEANQFSEQECKVEGGEFNECASACRHDPKAEVCTMQCVLTCTFR